jgi:hypothetical protein
MAKAQLSLENTFLQVARSTSKENGKPSVVLCDRGVLDGAAYMSDHEFQALLDEEGWKLVDLRDKYDVIPKASDIAC